MYCNQCEQTAKGIACTAVGVCGKNNEVSVLQDLLLHVTKDLSHRVMALKEKGVSIPDSINHYLLEALFATLTNVNFDSGRLTKYIEQGARYTESLSAVIEQQGIISSPTADRTSWLYGKSSAEIVSQAEAAGYLIDLKQQEDLRSLQEILLHGLKGIAAYAYHALILNEEHDAIYQFLYESLASFNDTNRDLDFWLGMVMKCGEINLLAMELLDKGNTGQFGHPVPTTVPLGHIPGKCILVSGHDLQDLHDILEATNNKGIYIYTHGEMLPAHGYPELKKYPHFYGHFGTAWQNQRQEFQKFPGAILMTTNCLQPPQANYADNLFTTGPVGWLGVKHVERSELSAVIQKAMEMPGFDDTADNGSVMVGFAHNTVLSIADTVIEAVKSGKIKHFLLVGGCDGARSGRNYYTDFVAQSPADTVILTLGCGKFRFFDQDLGSIEGIPRLLDVGQCNDAYSAVQIALALANAFDCTVNELPLSLVLSWYEQKAVSILLSLLHLGIKDIRLGPTLPAFISPGVLGVLVERFAIKPIATPEEDLSSILG